MYHNDSLRFMINGHYTEELWLTKGVKQGLHYFYKSYSHLIAQSPGCNLSPLLFAIFLNNLGQELNSSNLGIDLGNTNISAIFFADDIVLIGSVSKALDSLMKITQTYFFHHRLHISQIKT